jgi:predicted DNA-binding ribbon-helix-helix protein
MQAPKKNALVSRNITINGRRTSVRLESQMWIALKEVSEREKCTIHDICSVIASRKSGNITLTAAIRIFLVLYYKAASTEEGHSHAGHGSFQKMMARVAEREAQNLSYHDERSRSSMAMA